MVALYPKYYLFKMKIYILFIFLLIMVFSCKESGKINITYESISEIIGKCENGDDVFIKINYPIIKNDTILEKLLNDFIITDFTDISLDIKGILENFKNDFFEIRKLYPDEKIKCWYVILTLEVLKQHSNIITFKQYHEEDRGGDHKIIHTYYLNYDLETKTLIDLENISNDFDKLTSLAKECFFEKYDIKSDDDLEKKFLFRDNEFYLPDNFYFTDHSIIFLFRREEIQDFSNGEFPLEIPYLKSGDILDYKY